MRSCYAEYKNSLSVGAVSDRRPPAETHGRLNQGKGMHNCPCQSVLLGRVGGGNGELTPLKL
eukprot:1158878-Pelagomonas_calceolata.AAC.6